MWIFIYLFLFCLGFMLLVHIMCFYLFSRGDFGRLGHGNSSDLFTPQPIKALYGLKIKQIACGDSHCLAVTVEGEVQRLVIFPKFSLNLYFDEWLEFKLYFSISRVVVQSEMAIQAVLLKFLFGHHPFFFTSHLNGKKSRAEKYRENLANRKGLKKFVW